MLTTDAQIKNYDAAGNHPITWYLSADSLLAAAKILKVHRDSYKPFEANVGDVVPDEGKILSAELMLKGFAIECLLKGLWLKSGNFLASNGKYISIPGANDHDLLQLSAAVKVSLSDLEKDLLKRLSKYTVSIGRYPIPRDWSVTQLQKAFRGGAAPPTYWSIPGDDVALEGLVASLMAKYDLLKQGLGPETLAAVGAPSVRPALARSVGLVCMRISAQTRILLIGAVTALLIYGASQLITHSMDPRPDALNTDPRLQALSSECTRTGNIYDVTAKHFGGTNQDGTSIIISGACENLFRLWEQVEPWSETAGTASGQPKAWSQYAEEWATPVAAIVLALSALPWLWYFILRRIRELREAILGK